MEQYFTYEARLASFQRTSRKRGSTASGRGKAHPWPHKQIAPASLAKAGFYFDPTPDNPDNVACFLCGKEIDGWEPGDDPLLEHLKHVSHCGWAIVAAIEADVGGYGKEDPRLPYMVEARKATFAGKWPHEAKKGWKCKTKQLVDAGWKYTPTAESDDMATCAYCELALDGWEPNDKPYDEHYDRSPGCAFFALMNQFEGAKKKTGRGKATRGSKASRLSSQSVATAASETFSVADATADVEDSVLTSASTMTQRGRKPQGRKAAAAKAGRSKAKKNDPAEAEVNGGKPEPDRPAPRPQPAKATRARKRGSDVLEDSVVYLNEEPVPKKRATRNRSSTLTDASTVTPDDSEMSALLAPARKATARRKGRGSNAETSRQTSAVSTMSTASMASLRGPPGEFPDDEEIERQLEADLAREWHEDDNHGHDSDHDMHSPKESAATQASADYAIFNPAAPEADDAAVEEELLALQAEMQVEELEQLHVPKKGRKAGVRKTSKQTKARKAKAVAPPPPPEEPVAPEPVVPVAPEPPSEEAVEERHDTSVGSTKTVIKTAESAQTGADKRARERPSEASLTSQPSVDAEESSAQPPAKQGRGCPSKASLASRASSDAVELVEPAGAAQQPAKRGRGRPSKASLASQGSSGGDEPTACDAPLKRGRGRPPKKSAESTVAKPNQPAMADDGASEAAAEAAEAEAEAAEVDEVEIGIEPRDEDPDEEELLAQEPLVDGPLEEENNTPPLATKQDAPPHTESASQYLAEPPSTPAKVISPAPSARQPALSPSQSLQSSDAENQPPSSKPAASATLKRVVLAPITATPMRNSPSKRNVLAGLESSTPWTAVNIDAVLGTPGAVMDKENVVGRLLKQGRDLSSPEKRMTVEEWVYFNAAEAEKKLKHECEAMVNKFEREGTRAMNVLEGLSVE